MTRDKSSLEEDKVRPGASGASGSDGGVPARGVVELQEDALEQVAGGARLTGQVASSKGQVDYSWKVEAGEK